jgi:hypothetical protein
VAVASSSRPKRRRASTRGARHRYKPIDLGMKRWIVRASMGAILLAVILVGWAVMARRLAPAANTSRDHFDAILVLGYRADADGNPTPEEMARVSEAVREYERGVAPRLLFTGGRRARHSAFCDLCRDPVEGHHSERVLLRAHHAGAWMAFG